jgi:hypothetical protein
MPDRIRIPAWNRFNEADVIFWSQDARSLWYDFTTREYSLVDHDEFAKRNLSRELSGEPTLPWMGVETYKDWRRLAEEYERKRREPLDRAKQLHKDAVRRRKAKKKLKRRHR